MRRGAELLRERERRQRRDPAKVGRSTHPSTACDGHPVLLEVYFPLDVLMPRKALQYKASAAANRLGECEPHLAVDLAVSVTHAVLGDERLLDANVQRVVKVLEGEAELELLLAMTRVRSCSKWRTGLGAP